ncbi:MAG TPA: TlpA disulfide reductase family protein [Puia sp.]|nr:TlpA disulfide reductase family protein [Puia sp.]
MRLIILVSLLALSSIVNAQVITKNTFRLAGKVAGQDTGYVHLNYLNSSGKYINDSFYLKNGEFEFSGSISEPTVAQFYGNIKSRSVDDLNTAEIFIEPTKMHAIFNVNDFKHGKIAGSNSQNEFAAYSNQREPLEAKWRKVFDELDTARAKNDTAKIEFLYTNRIPFYSTETDSLSYSFIKQFPGSHVSAYLLIYLTQKLTADSLKMFYSLLTSTVQKSANGKRIEDYIAKEESLLIGKQAPNFAQTDANGNNISLKDFRGKFVLLDFWASWCVPCREENPYLKEAYAKYHNKGFTIISFSLDGNETKNAWKDAIKQDALSWTQVCDFKVWRGEVVNEYNLFGKGIPRSFLINPAGQIIAKDLRGDEVEKKLAEILK